MGNSKSRRKFLKSINLEMISDEEITSLFQSYISKKDANMTLSKSEALKLLSDIFHKFMEEIDNEIKELHSSGEFNEEIEINYQRIVEIRKHGQQHLIEDLFEKIDVDKNHVVDLNEFRSWMKVFIREKFKIIDAASESPLTTTTNESTALSSNNSEKENMRKGVHGSILLISGGKDHHNHGNEKNLNSMILDEGENVETYCGILQIGRKAKVSIDVRNQAGALMTIEVCNENDAVTNNGSLGVEIFQGSKKISDFRHIHPGQKLTLTDIPIPPLSSYTTSTAAADNATTTTSTITSCSNNNNSTTTVTSVSTSNVSSTTSMETTRSNNELSSDAYKLHVHLTAGLNCPKVNYAIKTSW